MEDYFRLLLAHRREPPLSQPSPTRGEGKMTRNFLNLSDAGGDAIAAMIGDAIDRKAARVGADGSAWPKGRVDSDAPLAGHVLGMIFEEKLDPYAGEL